MPKTTTSSRSQTKSSNTLSGKKVTRSTGKSQTASKSSSPRSRTQKSLEEKTKSLTSVKQPKKTGKTSGTTAKAKAKTTTKGTTSGSQRGTATSKRQTKKPTVSTQKPSVKRTTRQNSKDRGVKHTRSKDIKLFPVNCMPWRLEPRTGKFNLSWYMCFDHAVDQIERQNLSPRDYKLQCYVSVPLTDPLTGSVRIQRYVRQP